jgi:DNA-binding IclR family transcriptional regulator
MPDFGKTIAASETSLDVIDQIKTLNGARLSEISRELDISKSSVHNHLSTLRSYGYVTKEGETYHLSLKFFMSGSTHETKIPVIR